MNVGLKLAVSSAGHLLTLFLVFCYLGWSLPWWLRLAASPKVPVVVACLANRHERLFISPVSETPKQTLIKMISLHSGGTYSSWENMSCISIHSPWTLVLPAGIQIDLNSLFIIWPTHNSALNYFIVTLPQVCFASCVALGCKLQTGLFLTFFQLQLCYNLPIFEWWI